MKNIKSILALSLGLVSLAACSKWTDTEIKNPTDLTHNNKTDAYYAALRAYKKTDHQIAFGWFGNWTGRGSVLQGSLAGLPDSVDIVSIWGTVGNLTEEQKVDLKYFQEVKGGKAMLCWIIQDIGGPLTPRITDEKIKEYQDAHKAAGNTKELSESDINLKWRYEYWGYDTAQTEEGKAKRLASAEKYANAICDTLDKYGLNGFDIDYEPNYGHSGSMGGKDDMMLAFIEALGKRIGAKSGTGRILALDGEPQSIVKAAGPYIDYFIVQAYKSSGYSDLDSRIGNTMRNFDGVLTAEEVARKYVVTENFESYASAGGVMFQDRKGNKVPSLIGMAMWNPIVNGVEVPKAGIGTYHMEYEYRATVPDFAGWTKETATSAKRNFVDMSDVKGATYPWLRKGIKLMNPVIK